MRLQNYELKTEKIKKEFENLKKNFPERLKQRINISFCSQCFGNETVAESIQRLSELGYQYIEIPGNYGGPDSGNHTQIFEIRNALEKYNMKVSGICPLTPRNAAMTTPNFFEKQNAMDYVKGNIDLCKALGGTYYLITPGPCGSPEAIDEGDWDRSVEMMKRLGDYFAQNGIKAAVEPVNSAYTPICHSLEEAEKYIREVDHPGLQHIYGDLAPITDREPHIGEAIIKYGTRLLNLHVRDTVMGMGLGNGSLDLDTIIRALYLIGFNTDGHYVVGEPEMTGYIDGGGFNIFLKYPETAKRKMAEDTIRYFREREDELLS